jgi:hypothetical protein
MFKTIGSMIRTARALLFPLSRTVLIALLWSNRYTVGLWYRSVVRELRDNGFVPSRVQNLGRALWTVTSHQAVANSPALRMIRLREDGFEIEARNDWFGRPLVEELLAPVPPYPTTVTAA